MTSTKLLLACFVVSLAFVVASASYKPIYYPYGPQMNVPLDQLRGWKRCWISVYNSFDRVSDVFNNCTGAHLLYGCRNQTDSFNLLAVGNRTIMTNDTGSDNADIVSTENGVAFYFSNDTSIGFAKQGDAVYKDSCDTEQDNGEYRLCWHAESDNFYGGYRCGAVEDLNSDEYWLREIWMPADPCEGKNEGDMCDDFNECTTNTTCQSGVCTGKPADCGCFECDTTAGCLTSHVANGTTCDDDNMCTEVDTCQSGVCVGSSPKTCLSEQPCFNSTCIPTTGSCQLSAIEGCSTPTNVGSRPTSLASGASAVTVTASILMLIAAVLL